MNEEGSRGKCNLEFKQEAVGQVKAGRADSVVANTLGMHKASLTNRVRAETRGQLGMAADCKPAPVVAPEQAEIARLRAEVARLKLERDIAREDATYFAQDVLQGTPGSGR